MAIIKFLKGSNNDNAYLNSFPDQFKTEKEKENPDWIKNTADYFANKAYIKYVKNRDSFVKNYDLMKGILRMEDFYQEPEVKSFVDTLQQDLDLPAHVKHYSIITTPINNLVGERTKRPDTYKVKAFDDDSQSEELQFKTGILNEFVLNMARQKILQKAAEQGEEIDEEQLEQLTLEQVKDQLDSYTSVAEKWGNHILTCQKADFNIKEKTEETFRDLCITSRFFFHIYEDNSKVGYNIVEENPKNVWYLITPDKKYISDPSGRQQGAYAAGTMKVMELSEIIESTPELTKDEIDHLRDTSQNEGVLNVRESNLGNPNAATGINSVMYDTYDPLVEETRMIIESEMSDSSDSLAGLFNHSTISSVGYKFIVINGYFISKKKIGKVTWIDEMGNIQSDLVDENYKSGSLPTQIDLQWGWVNQWYKFKKIGSDIYHMSPFKLLDYCPIIGTIYEAKNTEPKSLVDLMKPFQVIYNISMNQLYTLLEKEIGNVASVNIRRIPKLKDGDDQDAVDVWEMEARQRGVVFDDDSPENTKAPVSNTSIAKNIDLTRTNEIQSRYNLAVQIKNECWELIGMSKQRLGNITASESATGTNAAIQQSYSQTEPLFVAHEYVMGQLYQAILDASLFIESNKPESTLSYITSEGQAAFVKVNGTDLKFRDLKVFPTNRPEDVQMFNELRMLSQAVIQNGGTLYDIVELYSTKSVREIKKTFKELRDNMLAMQQQAQELEQQKLQQAQQIAAAQMEQQRIEKEQEMLNDNYQKELERINKKEIALINADSKMMLASTSPEQTTDPLEFTKLSNEREKLSKDYSLKLADIQSKLSQNAQKMQLEREKLQVEKENMKNDIQVAKINASNRASKSKK